MQFSVNFNQTDQTLPVSFDSSNQRMDADFGSVFMVGRETTEVSGDFSVDNTLKFEDGVLSVNTAKKVEANNTLPVTSAAVHVTVGNIEVLLNTI